jgi:hypothetical protein
MSYCTLPEQGIRWEAGHVEKEQARGTDPAENLLASVQLADSELREVHQSREQDSEERVSLD